MEALKINSDKIKGQISVFVYEDTSYPHKGLWIAYCPELDLAGYDYGKEAAQESLKYVLTDYFDYALANKTLEKDLIAHGWKKQHDSKLVAPSIIDMTKKGKLDKVLSAQSFSKSSIPIMA